MLTEQRAAIRASHDRKLSGPQVSAKLASMVDMVIQRLFDATLATLSDRDAEALREDIAIVGLGSYARRQCSAYSDVDLMVLHQKLKTEDVAAKLRLFTQGIFDVGLQLGHSIRTASEAVQLARSDTVVCTSLMDVRLLLGNRERYQVYRDNFKAMVRKNSSTLRRQIMEARAAERNQYGETIYLLEPHVKRSRGGTRDMNLLRWLGFVEHGTGDPDRLHLEGALSKFDYRRLLSAREFLLRLRNEMHFHAGKTQDLLNRAEQVRVAEWLGHTHRSGLLPVEHFMRDYFRHTNHIWQLVRRREANLQPVSRVTRVLDPMLSKTVDGNYRVGLKNISATPQGIAKLKSELGEVLRVVKLSVTEKKPLDHPTWSALVLAVTEFSDDAPLEVRKQLYELLGEEKTVGEVLRMLHELGYLEKLVPAVKHARCLLQFNQYHKFTVDEHCLRAVRKATQFAAREDALGEAYKAIANKSVFHLALLLHDLGKGFEEDHSEVGKRLAQETAELFALDGAEADDLVFLVHKHLMMPHMTFRRDTSDERLIRQFAERVGSEERLRMLFVLSCADMAAVGPGVLSDWKVEVLADVFRRAVGHLAGNSKVSSERRLAMYRQQVLRCLDDREQQESWFSQQLMQLPVNYLAHCSAPQVAATLREFRNLKDGQAIAWSEYQSESGTIEFTAGVDQGMGRGVFSSMAGVLSSAGMQIHAASVDILAGGLLMLRYVATDPKSPAEPTAERLQKVCRQMAASVDSEEPPKFPMVWGADKAVASIQLSALPNEVRIDTELSPDFTIVEIFTFDRMGLLYKLARKLHDLELNISHAKIATHLDQVVDVFYVSDRQREKVVDPQRLEDLRHQLLELIELTPQATR